MPYAFVTFLGSVFDVIQAIFRISCEDGWEIVHLNDHVSDRSGFNIVLDYIFVAVFRLGTLGAAWEHFSITVSMLIVFYLFSEIQPYKVLQTED